MTIEDRMSVPALEPATSDLRRMRPSPDVLETHTEPAAYSTRKCRCGAEMHRSPSARDHHRECPACGRRQRR